MIHAGQAVAQRDPFLTSSQGIEEKTCGDNLHSTLRNVYGAAAGIRTRVPGSFHIVMGSRCHRPDCPSTLAGKASTLDHGRCYGRLGTLFLSVFANNRHERLAHQVGSTIRGGMSIQNPFESAHQGHSHHRVLPHRGTSVVGNQWFARQRDLHGAVRGRVRIDNREQFEQGSVLPDTKANILAS